jgi:maltose-binding protein MalE
MPRDRFQMLQKIIRRQPIIILVLALISLVILVLVVLALLGSDEGSAEPPGVASGPQRSPTAVMPLSLVIWHPYNNPERDALEQIRRDFEATYPNIDVQIRFVEESTLRTEYETAVTQGGGPDLLFGPATWIEPLAYQGMTLSISHELYKKITGPNYLTESIAHAALISGEVYAVPFSAELPTLYYNRSLVQIPLDHTLDNLKEQAQTHGLILPPTFFATAGFYLTPGGQLPTLEGDNLETAPDLKTYLTTLQDFAGLPNVAFTTDQSAFKVGEVGLLIGSSTDYADLRAALGDDLGITPFPWIPPNRWKTLISTQITMLSLNSTVEAINAADLFIAFLLAPETQLNWFTQTGRAPVNVVALEDEALRRAWSNTLEWGVPAVFPAEFEAWLPTLDTAVRAVTIDGTDPTTAAEEALDALRVSD